MPKRYPLRTVILMIVALAAFGRLWCLTHPPEVSEQTPTSPAEPARPTQPVTPPTPPSGPPSLGASADVPSAGGDTVPSEGNRGGMQAPDAEDAPGQSDEPASPAAPGEVR